MTALAISRSISARMIFSVTGATMTQTLSGFSAPEVPVPSGTPSRTAATARLSRLASLALIGLLVAACGGDNPESSKYEQTWSKAYGETTCEDWRSVMDEHQKFVMAADILYTQQKKLDADVGLPSDALIGQFQGQIQGLCLTNPTDDVTTAAFIVWTTGQDVFAP